MDNMDKASNKNSVPAKKNNGLLACILITVIVIALYFIPYGWYVLYPFMLIYTFFHESGHGIAGEIVGGKFDKFEMWADGSGVATTYTSTDASAFAHAFIAFGGLIAPAIMAAILLMLGRSPKASRIGLFFLGILFIAADILVVRNLFGLIFIAVCAAVSLGLALGIKTSKPIHQYSMLFLAINLLTAVFSRGDYLFTPTAKTAAGEMPSDVGQIANNLFLPYWFWGGLIALISVGILILGIKGFVKKFSNDGANKDTPQKAIPE